MLLFRLIIESFLFSIQELRTNKLRAFLSLLGITIGIFTIISVLSLVDSMENKIKESLSELGSTDIYIQKWPWTFSSDYPWWKYINRPTPNYREYLFVRKKLKKSNAVAIIVNLTSKTIKHYKNFVENASITAVSHEYDQITNLKFGKGRYFSMIESSTGANSAIIGSDIAEGLFTTDDVIGRKIEFMGRKFKIIGVFEKKGEDMLVNFYTDNIIMIPYACARKIIDIRSRHLDPLIIVKAKEGVSINEFKEEIRGVMRSIRHLKPKAEDNFALNQASMLSSQIKSLFTFSTMVGWIIGSFSILVGAFGVANIMFVSVRERTNIIGIKKSLGAKNYFVLLEFLLETIILCIIGGMAGILLVYIGILIASYMIDFSFTLSLGNILTGIFISIIIGIIAGFWPALVASRMNPVDAIRFK